MDGQVKFGTKNLLSILLVKRLLRRMRQIRARRMHTQRCVMHKYLQYQKASQQLFICYALKLINFRNSYKPLKKKVINKCERHQKLKICRDQHWWEVDFPKMTHDEFYNTFHVQQSFYVYLCEEMASGLAPATIIPYANEGTSVEKQVAIGLYKLATGSSYDSTSKLFGLHRSTICKLFSKFLRQLDKIFGGKTGDITADECKEMNESLSSRVNIPNVIGALVRLRFSLSPTRIPSTVELLAIVDIDEKFHLIHVDEINKDDSFYRQLNKICENFFLANNSPSDLGLRYLVVTDQVVPQLECFLNKSNFIEGENMDKNYTTIIENINTVLQSEENAIRKLVERWTTLACNLDFIADALPYIIRSCVILHNLYEDHLKKQKRKHQFDFGQFGQTVNQNINYDKSKFEMQELTKFNSDNSNNYNEAAELICESDDIKNINEGNYVVIFTEENSS